MKIPDDAVIAQTKLTHYLLVPRPKSDTSKYLFQAGFSPDEPDLLLQSIRELAQSVEAIEDSRNEYGVYFVQHGKLTAPQGVWLNVTLVWRRDYVDDRFHFVTLKPWRPTR